MFRGLASSFSAKGEGKGNLCGRFRTGKKRGAVKKRGGGRDLLNKKAQLIRRCYYLKERVEGFPWGRGGGRALGRREVTQLKG